MRALILLITALLCAAPALAETLLIVQSNRDRAGTALQQSVTRTVKVPTELLVLSDYARFKRGRPRLIHEDSGRIDALCFQLAFKYGSALVVTYDAGETYRRSQTP